MVVVWQAKEWDRALIVFRAMQKAGARPDITSFTAAIQCYSWQDDPEGAEQVFKDMVAAGARPGCHLFPASLPACCALARIPRTFLDFAAPIASLRCSGTATKGQSTCTGTLHWFARRWLASGELCN